MRGSVREVAERPGFYEIRYDLPADPATGKRRQAKRWVKGKRAAERALREAIGEVETGRYVDRSKVTLAEYLRRWLDGIRVKPTTLANYRGSAETYVIPRLGGLKLDQVTAEHLDALYRELERSGKRGGKPLAPKTVRHCHTMLRKALQDAVERGHLARNVADLANPPTQRQARSRAAKDDVWMPEQLRAFVAFVAGLGNRLYAAWHLLATTGMRRAELLGLRWSDLDLDAGTARVGEQTVTVADGPQGADGKRRRAVVWQADGKTDAAARTVALDEQTVSVLREHRVRQLAERMAWPGEWVMEHGDLVFRNADGSGVHPERFSAWHLALVRKAGLPEVDVHGLRHSYATAALRAGVPVHVLSARLGHANEAITLTLYSHVLDGDDAAAAAAAASAILGG